MSNTYFMRQKITFKLLQLVIGFISFVSESLIDTTLMCVQQVQSYGWGAICLAY